MRTIILLTVSFILIFIFATCNKEQPVNYTTRLNKQPRDTTVFGKEACGPCCNAGKPVNCENVPILSLYVYDLDKDICITCECCKEVYEFYGNPENLYGIEIPSTLIGSQICIPAKEEE